MVRLILGLRTPRLTRAVKISMRSSKVMRRTSDRCHGGTTKVSMLFGRDLLACLFT